MMKRVDLEVATSPSENGTGVVWTADQKWNSVTEYPDVDVLVSTTSWQQLRNMFINARVRHIIAPSIVPVDITEKKPGRSVCWAGDPTDGTLLVLLSLINAMTSNGVKLDLTVACSTPPSPATMELVDPKTTKIIKDAGREDVIEMMKASQIFAHPSMSWQSFNPELMTATSAGCLVVAPKHSGFVETCGSYGFLCPHIRDNGLFASSFAAVLNEVLGLSSDESAYDAYWRHQKRVTDFIYGIEKEEFAWKELSGFLKMIGP